MDEDDYSRALDDVIFALGFASEPLGPSCESINAYTQTLSTDPKEIERRALAEIKRRGESS